jgi:hypothetical protein
VPWFATQESHPTDFIWFRSDNGYHLGEHKLVFGKGQPYEPSVRLPMYVRGPGVPQGVISKLPTTHLDITATIVALAGATNGPATPADLDGLSFAPALLDSPAAAKLRATPEHWRSFSFSEFFMNDCTWWNVRTVNSTHKFSYHYWCDGTGEVFNLLADPLQLKNLAGDTEVSSGFGRLAAAEMLPLAMSLSMCSHESCWKPAATTVPPIAANGTHLPCYQVKQAPKHPEYPTGNLGKVDPISHHFQGYACIPDPERAAEVVAVQIQVDGVLAAQLEANISRPDLRYKTPCGGAAERHGFAGSVPASAMSGKHQLAAYAVHTPMVLLGKQAICDGKPCGPDEAEEEEGEENVAWTAERTMLALLGV